MGSNPVEARNPFFRAFSQLLKLPFTAMVTYSFHLYSRSSHHFILCICNLFFNAPHGNQLYSCGMHYKIKFKVFMYVCCFFWYLLPVCWKATVYLWHNFGQMFKFMVYMYMFEIPMGWWLLWLTVKILAFLQLTVNFFPLRLMEIRLEINFHSGSYGRTQNVKSS